MCLKSYVFYLFMLSQLYYRHFLYIVLIAAFTCLTNTLHLDRFPLIPDNHKLQHVLSDYQSHYFCWLLCVICDSAKVALTL